MPILAAYMVPHPPMIVPEVGKGSEQQIRETIRAYEQAADEIAALQPETIIISSPHSVMYSDYFHISPGKKAFGDFGAFRARSVSFTEEYDEPLVREICDIADAREFPAGTMGERDRHLDHGTMVPLYFIRQKYRGGRIVRIGLSGLPLTKHYELGQIVCRAVESTGRKAVYVASGDLSHKLQSYGPYGFAPEGPEYDRRIMDVCSRAAFGELFDFDENFCDKAAECGHRSFVIMAGALDGLEVEAKQLSHEDVTGVGYGICTFRPGGESEDRRFLDRHLKEQEVKMNGLRKNEDAYVRLARQTIEEYIRDRRTLTALPDWVTDEMKTGKAGVFVSIHEHGQLRGCIGTILPTRNCIGHEIIGNAISAAVRDPRFDPIREDELPWLEIHVDVLTAPERISGKDQLDVKKYGVIVTSGAKRGLLLPDLEGVDSVDQQVAIAMRKGGINAGDPVTLERFEVIRHT
ncbi:MAG: AmmeMemoRadiSam system protein A [Clostridia bacterium]|nr:AmmeMemoRadiSam system protein A [Clostridia bacterium]